MKTVSILYHIIKNYMIRNKSIFIVFITSYILMGLLIVFIYGAFFPYVSERRSKDLLDCRYIVNFDGEMPIECCAKQTEFTGNQIARGFFVCKRKRIHRTGPGANNVSYYQ